MNKITGIILLICAMANSPHLAAQTFSEMVSAAEKGDVAAENNLCEFYANDYPFPHDYIEAEKWCRKAAEQGLAIAQYNLSILHFKILGDSTYDQKSLKWLRKAAGQGLAPAQLHLGLLYNEGNGVPQDNKIATSWIRKAAEQGHPSAQYNLGTLYDTGRGVPQNYNQAANFYRKAAEQGHPSAQFNLALMHIKGQGVKQNNELSYFLFNLQAATGDDQAREFRDKIIKVLTPEQISNAQRLAGEWEQGTPLPY